MSVQFGRWNFDGKPVDPDYLKKASSLLVPYGPDDSGSGSGSGSWSRESIALLFRAFHTTEESRSEGQPHVSRWGEVLSWDGRLDNRAELIRLLGAPLSANSSDVEIVSSAYEHWQEACLPKLLGDWALTIWNPRSHLLILAKDPVGTRHLYYFIDDLQVTWSTILDPILLLSNRSFSLSEEYMAGWLTTFPAPHLTPYAGIHLVPPSSSVLVTRGKSLVKQYWAFDPDKRIHYRADADYEEHFRTVFGDAVRRRLRAKGPVIAELSGGLDSSSIVCMADSIVAPGQTAQFPRIDTISYYDDTEPDWNERPYFAEVEQKRGRTGCHIDLSSHENALLDYGMDSLAMTPASGRSLSDSARQSLACVETSGTRVLLSGTGGDETMGGVPTPIPELQDLLVSGAVRTLARQLKLWALNKKKPWFHLLAEATRPFFPQPLPGLSGLSKPAPWLTSQFVQRNRLHFEGYPRRLTLTFPAPSFQGNIFALDGLRRQLACTALCSSPLLEKRYPFLDRDLLEFAFAIPREQLVRPGQRRSLMRRSLVGIVPDKVLNRRRKAYVARAPVAALARDWDSVLRSTENMFMAALDVIDPPALIESLLAAQQGRSIPLAMIIRTLAFERWLVHLNQRRALRSEASAESDTRVQSMRVAFAAVAATGMGME